MIIGLIGMSGAGKRTWAARFAAAGFTRYDCDALIARRLHAITGRPDATVDQLGSWMGLPYEPGYREREAAYLAAEHAVVHTILAELAATPAGHNIVIDMSGSVIYIEPDLLAELRRQATIAYLVAAPHRYAELLAAYARTPRPLVWHGQYQPLAGEPPALALGRCYTNLIASRIEHYRALCHVAIDDALHSAPECSVADLLNMIRQTTQQTVS